MATLDGPKIKALLDARDWTWETLHKLSGKSVRRLIDIGNEKADDVNDDTVFQLAAAFQVEPESLFRTPSSSARWMIPPALHDHREILPNIELMQHLDMAGEAEKAEQMCRNLRQTVPRKNWEARAYLTVLLAVYLEHLHRSSEALELLQAVEAELKETAETPRGGRRSQAALLWVQYQEGVCQIAEGALDKAQDVPRGCHPDHQGGGDQVNYEVVEEPFHRVPSLPWQRCRSTSAPLPLVLPSGPGRPGGASAPPFARHAGNVTV